jgi:serine/threonine protein kinase
LDICAALKDLHALGIIHRDIKPSNVVRKDISLSKRSSGVKTSSRRNRKHKAPTQFLGNTSDIGFGSQQVSMGAPLTEEIDSNVQSENLLQSNNFQSSFRSFSKYFGLHVNYKNGGTASIASQNACDTVGSSSTEPSRSSATGQVTMTASIEIKLPEGEQGAALQSCCSDQLQGLAICNMPSDAAARVPSVEKHAKQYSYMLIDLGSAIGKQEAAEDAGANLSLALQTFSENAFVGTPAYASPETFIQQASSK